MHRNIAELKGALRTRGTVWSVIAPAELKRVRYAPIKIRDMRVDFYTLERRGFGQAEGAHESCASERRSQTPPRG